MAQPERLILPSTAVPELPIGAEADVTIGGRRISLFTAIARNITPARLCHTQPIHMSRRSALLALPAAAVLGVLVANSQGAEPPAAPSAIASLGFPQHYREWVFLSSGFDMSYDPPGKMQDHHRFNNVFVNPEAYRTFMATGTWPDGTMLVLEIRRAEQHGSINKSGSYQGSDVMGLEVHWKDSERIPGKWGFFSFDDDRRTAAMIPPEADCYACHRDNGAVDDTFVQFYPTLLPIARAKDSLTASYKKNP